jgi:hypothetical protein
MNPLMERPERQKEEERRVEIADGVRKPYSAPVLTVLGDIRDLTMGGSPGSGDSGEGIYTQFPAGWPG